MIKRTRRGTEIPRAILRFLVLRVADSSSAMAVLVFLAAMVLDIMVLVGICILFDFTGADKGVSSTSKLQHKIENDQGTGRRW